MKIFNYAIPLIIFFSSSIFGQIDFISIDPNRVDLIGGNHVTLSQQAFVRGWNDRFATYSTEETNKSCLKYTREGLWVQITISNPTSEPQGGILKEGIKYPNSSEIEITDPDYSIFGLDGWSVSLSANETKIINIPVFPNHDPFIGFDDVIEGTYEIYFSFSTTFPSTPSLIMEINNDEITSNQPTSPGIMVDIDYSLYDTPPSTIDVINAWTQLFFLSVRSFVPQPTEYSTSSIPPRLGELGDRNAQVRIELSKAANAKIELNDRGYNYSNIKVKWSDQTISYYEGNILRTAYMLFDRAANIIDIKVSSTAEYPTIENPELETYTRHYIDDEGFKHTEAMWFNYGIDKHFQLNQWMAKDIQINHDSNIDVTYVIKLEMGPYQGRPNIEENGGVIDYAMWQQNPANVNWLAVSGDMANLRLDGTGIQDISSNNLFLNEPSNVVVNIIAPSDGNYYVKVFNDNLLQPEWNWESTSTSLIAMNAGQSWNFSFDVTPNTTTEGFQFWLYKQSWLPGVFFVIEKVTQTLTAAPLPSIYVTTPLALANWQINNPETIEWSSQNLSGNVNIKLSTDGGSTFPMTLISNTPNDGSQQITVPNLPSSSCRVKVESSNNNNIFGLNPGNFTIIQLPQIQNTLYAGAVTPTSGSTLDNFNFIVTYKSTGNVPPDNVLLHIINQFTDNMTASGSNWQQGVQFSKALNNFAVGQYEYYFTATVSGQQLRYPDVGNLNFSVTQNVAGWDLGVVPEGSYLSPSTIRPGTTINVNCDIYNYSNAGNTYTNVPFTVELRSPSGQSLDQNSDVIPSLASNTGHLYTLDLDCPSGAINGSYSVIITAFPNVDSNPINNSLTLSFYIGPILSKELYTSPKTEFPLYIGDEINVCNHQFKLVGLSGSGWSTNASFQDLSSGGTSQIYTEHMRFYSSYNAAIAVNSIDRSSDLATVRPLCAVTEGGPTFSNTEIIGYPGQSDIYFDVEAPPSKYFSNIDSDFDDIFTTGNTENKIRRVWFDKVTLYNNNRNAKIYFDIPSTAAIDDYIFYQPTSYQGSNELDHFTRVRIKIIARPPSITSLSRYDFSADDEITITGTTFGTITNGSVKFNDLVATQINQWNSTTIKVVVPVGVQPGNIYVLNSNGISNGVAYTVISSTGAPVVISPIPDQSIYQGETKFISNLSTVFSDPNNQILTYSATSSNQNLLVLQDSLIIKKLYLHALANATGTPIISVTATDPTNKSVTDQFIETVLTNQQAFITLTSPNGGENWAIGSQQTITWASNLTSGNIKIEISRDGGISWVELYPSTPDDGGQNWTVIAPTSTNAKIRISDVDGNPFDVSDNAFVINVQNLAPILTWNGETGYETDGVNPNEGNTTSTFTFRVKYSDADGDAPLTGYPRVHIMKGNVEITNSPMTEFNSDPFTSGRIYTYTQINLQAGTDYTYSFEARDVNNNQASGVATFTQSGPIVNETQQSSYWTTQSTDPNYNLQSVFFINDEVGWAAGSYGTAAAVIIKTTDGGNNWAPQYVAFLNTNLYSVFFIDANLGWCVGSKGTILKTTNGGNTWQAYYLDSRSLFMAVFFINDHVGWAAGWSSLLGGVVTKTTDAGQTWSQESGQVNRDFNSIYFVNANIGWVAGLNYSSDQAIIRKTTDGGINWTNLSIPYLNSIELYSIQFINSNLGWCVGEAGTTLKTTDGGNTWSQNTIQAQTLRSICLIDSANGFAVGDNGMINHTTTGGNIWAAELTGTTNSLKSVNFPVSFKGWAVGDNGTILRYYNSTASNLSVNLKVFLEGPYNGSGLMTTTLNTNNLIPLNSDIAYPTATFSYTASVVGSIPNSSIVDWVLIELRTGTASGTKVATRAAFLKDDGTIVDIDGSSPVSFNGVSAGNYYIVVRHRNHLAIMSASAIPLSSNSSLYDFTSSQSQAYITGTDPMVALSGGGFGMIAADANNSAIITAADVTPIIVNLNLSVYSGADVNMSAIVTAADVTKIISNLNKATNVP